ncbi:MAG: SAM-dependent methyltransferase [Myxococcota bacterium]
MSQGPLLADEAARHVARQYDAFQTGLERIGKERKYLNYGYAAPGCRRYEDRQAELCRRVFELAGVAPGHRVVDVGFGSGEQDLLFAREARFARLDAFNISAEQVRYANDQARRAGLGELLHFHRGPAEDMAVLGDASVDRVLAVECAFYFDRPRFYREAHRVLAPGGRLALADIAFDGRLGERLARRPGLERVGTFAANRRAWEGCFETLEVRDIRRAVRPGAQQTVGRCLGSLRYRPPRSELVHWLSMAAYTQLVVLGLWTGVLRYDLILLEKPAR